MAKLKQYVRFFSEFGIQDLALVGSKNASLGEMYRKLTSQGLKIPNGFAITAEGYRYVLDARMLGSPCVRLSTVWLWTIWRIWRAAVAVRARSSTRPVSWGPEEADFRGLSPASGRVWGNYEPCGS